jgi:hypothetical protein
MYPWPNLLLLQWLAVVFDFGLLLSNELSNEGKGGKGGNLVKKGLASLTGEG